MLVKMQDIVTRRLTENGVIVIKGDFPVNDEIKGYIKILDQNFYDRVAFHGIRGLIVSYLYNEWETDDFINLFQKIDSIMSSNYKNKNGVFSERFSYFLLKHIDKVPKPDVDLSTEFYSKFLDKRMTYSCAYWDYLNSDLDMAGNKKYDVISGKAGLAKGDSVLDIGCGWGGFMGYAYETYGIKATGVTLSLEEVDYVKKRYPQLAKKTIQSDFFDHIGEYDKVIAIGIFEYMTVSRFRDFFLKVKSLLKPNGIFVMQTVLRTSRGKNWITEGMDYFDSFMDSVGEFGCLEDISKAYSEFFILENLEVLSGHYPPTLIEWKKRIMENDTIPIAQKKLWELYLNFNILGFKNRHLDPYQFVFSLRTDKEGR
jgi:cyclopropane-fatty-acyl-phospholipid synthase